MQTSGLASFWLLAVGTDFIKYVFHLGAEIRWETQTLGSKSFRSKPFSLCFYVLTSITGFTLLYMTGLLEIA